jgi:antitoxin (DNA-binding transcriptional repressor) of toxin-antitoxin stability system
MSSRTRLREMLDSVAAGHTYIVYQDSEHTKPLAAVVPYSVYTSTLEALRQLEIIEEADRGNLVRDDDAKGS